MIIAVAAASACWLGAFESGRQDSLAKSTRYVILTNLTADDPYYAAVKLLAGFRRTDKIVPFPESNVLLARGELRQLQPHYVALAVRPETIDANFVARAFQLSTQMNADAEVDFACGYVTGETPYDAVKLIRNTIRAEQEQASLPKKFCAIAQTGEQIGSPGRRDILLRAMERYAQCFREDGWAAHVVEWPGEHDLAWSRGKDEALRRMSGSRLIFFAGHGGPTWTVGIASADLEDVDLYPAVVVNGGCNTGVTSRWFSVGPDKRICEVRIEPSRSLALRLIKQGAIAHFTALRGHAWSNCAPAVYPVYGAGQSAGEAMKAVYNIYMRLIRNGTEIDVPLLIPGNPYPSGSEWASPLRISACVLFGDPAYVPFPNADKNHHGLPKDFDPLR